MIKLLNIMNTQKIETKRSCQFSHLITRRELVIRKKLVSKKNLDKKVVFIVVILSPTIVLGLQNKQSAKMDC